MTANTDKHQAPDEKPETTTEAESPEAGNGNGDDNGDDEVSRLQAALAAAEAEATNAREAMLRMQAEVENLRKRLMKDLERSRKRALEAFMNDLLPVRDSLERGLEAADDTATVEALKEGKVLIKRMLDKVMTDHGLEEIDPGGEAFDPERHEAISMLPSPEHPENTVIEVVQKGFQLNGRLIRPARVVVSSGPPAA